MNPKIILGIAIAALVILVGIVAFILLSPVSAPSISSGANSNSGNRGLVAVSADGKIIPAPANSNLPANTATQLVRNTNITLVLTPFPPASFQKGTFEITLKDTQGQAITDAQVALDLTMPSMRMPANRPTAQHVGTGKYLATGTWTMRGWWRIQVLVVRGNETISAFFDVWL